MTPPKDAKAPKPPKTPKESKARRVVIAGAGGFMGTYFVAKFRADGYSVVTIGRSGADASWGDTVAIEAAIDGADLLLNLAGKSVNARYSEKVKTAILGSRVLTTGELGRAVESVARPPRLWLNASTATIYRHADDRPMTDDTGELGQGFSVNVATAWEREFFAHHRKGVRQVALRLAIVLGDGSALKPLVALTRLGFGGPQRGGKSGGGRQWFSWIHIEDVYRAIRFIEADATFEGTVNVSSPQPVRNRDLMATLRRVLGVGFGLPLFRWMIELGSFAIRSESELLLKSRWVLPTRLQREGFVFQYPELEAALRNILKREQIRD
ncbi:TIGR01777 family oxidoreductase [Glaciihabitans sp. dw_435]|uniref:TIGR01777 family oxidoreductase n=1 Tax=Glaciihabitans sp. dw_435 TaxID=2720081 RepID=UPI001BD1BCF5|nr:TIGR01777 family oxidoreductase [Glaciihabitans sp. dw_435]